MRPSLVLSESPSYSTPFYQDPWGDDGGSPKSDEFTAAEYDFLNRGSNRSSRTSSTCSHVLPEAAFLASGSNGDYLVDPYFGQKEIALLCSEYLHRAFNSVEETETSKRLGQPRLSVFIAQLIHLTGVPLKVVGAALILLQRFLSTLQSKKANTNISLSGHRLFIGALMLACCDDHVQRMSLSRGDPLSAAYWSDISLFSEYELDDIFNYLYDELEGNVVVFPSYAAAIEKLNVPLSIKSFEGDINNAFVAMDAEDDEHDVTDSEASLSNDSLYSCDHQQKSASGDAKSKSKKNGNKNFGSSSVRTRIVSLFSRKAKSS